jgi:acetoacetyl-CoA reductase
MTTTLITGGSRGIGLTIANRLLNKNHKIINLSKSGNISEIFKNNKNYEHFKIDISNINDTHDLVSTIVKTNKIDNIILNAGIIEDSFFHKMSKLQWSNVLNTNLLSIYGILHPIVNQMRTNNNGNIIFMSSINAHKGTIGQTNYASSKNGIIAFSRCLAIENANKNIKINTICPGYIDTEMTEKMNVDIKNEINKTIPIGRFGSKNEIADVVELLLNKNYFHGNTINVNGGLYMN